MAAGPRALSVHFPAVKIDKPVDGLQYVLKILSRRQLHVLSQNLRLPFLIRAIEDIIEVVASHMDLEAAPYAASGRPPNRVRVPAPGQIFFLNGAVRDILSISATEYDKNLLLISQSQALS